MRGLGGVKDMVFSTYVEVILVGRFVPHRLKCILHVCGGDPLSFFNLLLSNLYSPRMWR